MHTKNFTSREFVCKCGKCEYSHDRPDIIVPTLLVALQELRDKYQRPIVITSGRRCERHNRDVGGKIRSYHLTGLAADICGVDMLELARLAPAIPAFRYIELHDRYIHVDVGKTRRHRIMDYRTVKEVS